MTQPCDVDHCILRAHGGHNLGSAIVLELIMLHCIQYLFIISVFFYYPKL